MTKLSSSLINVFYVVTLCVSIAFLSACNVTQSHHTFEQQGLDTNIGNTALVAPKFQDEDVDRQHFDSQEIFALTEKQRSDFLTYFNSFKHEELPPHLRVSNYLQNHTQNFTFRGETLNASQALSRQEGNCLTLAILTTSLAKLANVPYKYKKVHSAPVFNESKGVQLLSSHLNVTLYNHVLVSGQKTLLSVGSIVIDYFKENGNFTSKRVDHDELLVMYWHNLASDALLEKDLDLAYSYTMMANDINPLHPETLNLRAILYKRKGQEDRAAKIYEFAVQNKLYSVTVIDNYANILDDQGESARAALLRQQTKDANDDNPYTWLKKAREYYDDRKYRLAELYARESVQRGPYIHEAQFLLAKVYFSMAKPNAAQEALSKARQLAYLPDDKKRYQAKLHSLYAK